jgi:hypothetical protein
VQTGKKKSDPEMTRARQNLAIKFTESDPSNKKNEALDLFAGRSAEKRGTRKLDPQTETTKSRPR